MAQRAMWRTTARLAAMIVATVVATMATGLGVAGLKGSVSGNDFMWSMSADLGGQSIELTYTCTLQDDGTLSGQLDLGGYGGGTFTGKRR